MFQSLFRRLTRNATSRVSQPRRQSFRPRLEGLEERTLLKVRTVVPLGVPTDGLSHFSSLSAALHASGYASGDVIQIEPGSVPGNVVNADLTAPGVPNLTIQGDPLVPLSTIPTFTVSDQTLLDSFESGITFSHVNMGLVGAGDLDFFFINATITASTVTDYDSTQTVPILFDGPSVTLSNSTFVNEANLAASTDAFIQCQPNTNGTPNTNSITGNTFEAIGPTYNLLQYYNGITNNLTVNDQITNNTFIGNTGQSLTLPTMLSITGTGSTSSGQISGMTIADNTFTDSDSAETAILLGYDTANVKVLRNSINLTGSSSYGLRVEAGGASITNTSGAIDNNQIATGGPTNLGEGIQFFAGASAFNVLNFTVQGNDFHNDEVGVSIVGTTSGPITGIDLGGGTEASPSIGGNDFRSFSATAVPGAGAIVVVGSGAPATTSIPAERNIFGVSNPQTVVGDFATNNNVSFNTSNNLTGNAAYVQTLYQDLFKRTGDTTNPSDAGYWVTNLNNGTLSAATVAHDISYSTESLDFQVNALYLRLLGRNSDSGGLTADANYLAAGGTMEQIIINIATSSEFNSKTGSNANFVESLYVDLLGRTAGASDVNGWLGQLATVGETGVVNGLLTSLEFRTDVATQLFGASPAPSVSVVSLLPLLLHRSATPPASSVSGWANQGLGILTIENDFLTTTEFMQDG